MLSAVAIGATVNAQSRLALYEEFSGENCGPCAASNPALNALIGASGNASKVLLIKYQSPIPSAGPIYNAYKTITNARMAYYNVPFAPYGRLDGRVIGTGTNAGHVANLTQTDINTDAAAAAKFTITVTHSWNAALDSVFANVTVKANTAFAPAGANMKLRVALIEHLSYSKAPGTNGETEFHNVVREMYPDATGTQLPNSWTASQSQSYTLKGKVAAYVDKGNPETRIVAWVQNDGGADTTVYQAAQSSPVAPLMDIASAGLTPASAIACGASSATVASTVKIKNTGTTTLTSAKVYARADNSSTYVTYNWTGSLAAGASTTVTMPAVTLTTGARMIIDSVAMPNGSADINLPNNVSSTAVTVINPVTVALPITQAFEASGLPTGWYTFDPNFTNTTWINGNGTGLAHNGSNYMPWFKINPDNGGFAPGSVSYLVTPVPAGSGVRTLEFWQAYAQYNASSNDKLEVVYSTNCGGNWTTLWSAAGAALATASAPTTTYWLPSPAAGSPDWKQRSVSLNSVPANAMIAFRATAGGGNNLFIDDVNLRNGPAGVENVISTSTVNLFPNPAKESATLEFTLNKGGKVVVNVLDAVGRTVSAIADATMVQGAQRLTIPTATLAAGVYNVSIQTEEGTLTQRLSVVK